MLGFAPIATTAICELPSQIAFSWYIQNPDISARRFRFNFLQELSAPFSIPVVFAWYVQHPAISRYQTPLDHFLTSRTVTPVVPTPIGKMWPDAIQSNFSGFEEVQPLLR